MFGLHDLRAYRAADPTLLASTKILLDVSPSVENPLKKLEIQNELEMLRTISLN